ncbi:glycogen/starch synthase [Porphyromonas pogonae]|uniref:glycogen/starch synthase n=1 Tax=Porphyromonas pogonae TaxID=867595 RepID=UPI002E79842F|nr:glycogen/starch synthase [Porphyromonas pogonae]
MDSKRVLFISQEIYPYLPETEISKISRELPQAIQEIGNEVRIFMPRYGIVNERRNQLHEVIRLSGINMIIDDNDHPLIIKVASIQAARMQVYFIDNDDFFKRKTMFNTDNRPVNDNDERSIFFVRGALEAIKKLRWIPDVIHCHGWFTALAMVYLKKVYHDDPCLKKAKVVYTVYNEPEAGVIPETLFDKLKFDHIKPANYAMMDNKTDFVALNKLAIAHADGVIQGSEHIDEALTAYIGESGKPFLPYQGKEDYAPAFDNFYNQL